MKIALNEMPEELKKLYSEYFAIFGIFPCHYEELDGYCLEAFDVNLLKEAIEKKIELPTLVLGDGYWNNGIDY